MYRFIIAGGGTGGHIFPAIAIARELQRRLENCELMMVGTKRGLEMKLIPEEGLPLQTIPVAGLKGKGLLQTARNAAMLPGAFAASWKILSRFRPDVVIGVGGYASGPIVATASLRKIPTLIHEQNMIPGSTNRWLAPHVTEVAVTFDETRDRLQGRGITTGNPVRRSFGEIQARPRGRKTRHLLIFGGSQGAAAINRAVEAALPGLSPMKESLRIIHQASASEKERLEQTYKAGGFQAVVLPFISDMASAFAQADLILARAGATTIAELTAAGRGSILIPLPSAIHDHQTFNAQALQRAGAARLLPQEDLTGEGLAGVIDALLDDDSALDAMADAAKKLGRPEAASRIADLAMKLAGIEVRP